jgi:hypothetical protein
MEAFVSSQQGPITICRMFHGCGFPAHLLDNIKYMLISREFAYPNIKRADSYP